ncbi:MAG TPA: DUF3168 domain-containing protein [Terracidiphilus sp.]|nr:DUF3168 domain-containing protein [Terracidiphilus sp.]
MIEIGLSEYLKAQPAIMSLLTVAGNVTVCPIPAPEDLKQYPVIAYQGVSYTSDYANDGPVGVAQKRIVLNCWSQAEIDGGTYLQANTIREAVRVALSGYQGTFPDGTKVSLIEIDGEDDLFSSESRQYNLTLHCLVQYAE